MTMKERIIWIIAVCLLIGVLFFGIFRSDALADADTNKNQLLKKLGRVLDIVENYYADEEKIDQNKLINGAIEGLLKALDDPHTEYLSKEFMNDLMTTSDGTYGGVGMIISQKDDKIVVVSPMEGYPAYKKGIKAGDYIISVDGVSLKDKNVTQAAEMLRGNPGTKVKVEIMRNGDVSFEVEITRAKIDLPSVKYSMIKDKYGYLRITQFAGTTSKHVKEALDFFNEKKAEGVIVDLRYNGGGLLREVVEIVDYFQDDGVIVSTIGRHSKDIYKAKSSTTLIDKKIPVLVIIDNGSASASEIFAGAIKDRKRGILIGEKSFGKGSVQSIFDLGSDGDGFKMTVAKYYTPNNICIDGIGIDPDIEVKEPELTKEEKDNLERLYKDKIIDKLIEENPDPDNEELEKLINKLIDKGYKLPKRYLKKLLRDAAEFDNDKRPIYDLEFDLQLQKSIELFENDKLKYFNGKFNLK